MNLKQSTTYTRVFLMIDSADHITGKTGLTCTVNLSKAGGAFAAAGGTITEIANGFYKIALTTTDTNTIGDLAFHVTATGADPTDFIDQVTANILGDTLPANVTQWNGTNVSAPATAGIPDVNVKNMNNVAATSITTINANQGTTQPVNFTGTGASALAKSDMVDIAGAAVSASTAQLGVNLVNIAGSAVNTASAQLGVNVVNAGGTAWGSGAITRAAFSADSGLQTVRSGTAQAGAAGTITLDASASATDNFYAGSRVYITGATGAGQCRTIVSYVGATKVATIDRNWITNPDATSTFAVIGADNPKVDASLQVTAASVQGNVTGSVASVTGAVGSVTGAVGSVTAGVTVTTNNDKTGYSLTQAFPTNFGSLAISVSGHISNVDTLTTYTGNTPQTGDAFARLGAPAGASVSADIAALPTNATVKTQVVAALNTDTYAEPAQGSPAATATLAAKINFLYKAFRNKVTQTSTTMSIFNDGGTVVDHKASASDDGTTFTRGQIATGP